MTSVKILNSVREIGSNAFEACSGLTSVTIPDSVKVINSEVFSWCTRLKSVVIPDFVTYIDSKAFYCCEELTSVVIGSSVTGIYRDCFSICSSLKNIYIKLETPWSGTNPFPPAIQRTCTVYVPVGAGHAYQSSRTWRVFTNIVEYDFENAKKEDVNRDGNVDTQDVLDIYNAMKEGSSLVEQDVNGGGFVDTQDVLEVYGYMKSQANERKDVDD